MSLSERIQLKCPDCEAHAGKNHLPNCSLNPYRKKAPVEPTDILSQFDNEIETITQRRGAIYGHPADDFATAADLMKHFDHIESTALRHALRMICVKLARLTTTPNHIDSYVDIVGYARCAVMVLHHESK